MQRSIIVYLLLLITGLDLPAQDPVTDPLITIVTEEINVRDLMEEISRQSGYNFSYDARLVDENQVVLFRVERMPLTRVLEALESKINLTWTIIGRQIILNAPRLTGITAEKEAATLVVRGYVTDAMTGETLPGATVSVAGTSKGVVTNGFGYYTINLPSGHYVLVFSYIGYQELTRSIHLQQDILIDVALDIGTIELPDVIVARPASQILEERDVETMILNPTVLQNLPEFGGESGLIKGLQTLPGIKTHSDGSAFFYTRGGEKDQNLIIIDDAPIFNPAHLFGFYSMVIPEFTKEIKVYKSDIPVHLGDRLSSIVSIRTKDGNLNQWQFSGAINPLVNRFSLELPVVRGNSSIFTSFRRSNFEWLYRQNNPNADLFFGDFNFKWNYRLGDQDRLYFTLISGRDALLNQIDSSGISWGNLASTIRWNHVFGKRLFSNTTLYTGSYRYRLGFADNAWESAIGTLSLKTDFSHYISASLQAAFGFEIAGFGFNPGTISTKNNLIDLPNIGKGSSRKQILYYEVQADISSRLKLKGGVRFSTWQNMGPAEVFTYNSLSEVKDTQQFGEGVYQAYAYPDPRLSIKYSINRTTYLKLSAGQYHQYIQLISNSVSPFTSFEVWLPSSPNIKPQRSRQVDLSLLKYFDKPGVEFSLATYYKALDNQIDFRPHANTIINPLLEGELRFGVMDAYGLELQLKKDEGKLNGWMNYTYSRAWRKTPGLNQGKIYPAFQDRPHDFALLVNYRCTPRIFFSSYFTWYSGSTFSSPTGFYRYLNQTVPVYSDKNNDRLPSYQRLDLALQFTLNRNLENRFQHSISISFYNALRHKNIVAVDFNKVPNHPDRPVVPANFISERDLVATQADLIRFMPSLTYKFKL